MGRRVVAKDHVRVCRVSGPVDLGEVLRAERLRRGMSQETFGALLGLTRQKVQQIEAGAGGVALGTTLRALADLGVALVAIPPRSVALERSPAAFDEPFQRAEDLLRALDFPSSGPGASPRDAGEDAP